MSKRILITGGAGFVGYHLAQRLSQTPSTEVVLVDNFIRGKDDEDLAGLLAKDNVRLVTGDLTQQSLYDQLGTGYDHVYHLAAIIGVENVLKHPARVVRVNAVATLKLLDWFCAGGGERFLFTSTSEVYAWTQQFHPLPVPTPEDVPLALTELDKPRASYAGSKIFGELAITHLCEEVGKPFNIVRFHNVYGPRMGEEHVVPQMYRRILNGENPLVVWSANHSRAFCYVDDAVDALLTIMDREDTRNQTYNIGNDTEEITILELAKRLLNQAAQEADLEPKVAEHDPIVRRCPDMGRLRDAIGYVPMVNLDAGLKKTLAWYANHWGTTR